MGYVSKRLAKMLVVFAGLAASLSSPSQAIDSKDEVNCFIHAPIQGQVAKMSVDIGQEVKKGDRLCTVSAMKMEFDILARFSGKIHSTLFKGGDYVEEGSLNGFPNMFLQERPQGFFKPALFDDAGYCVVACARWMAGLTVLAHLFFMLKAMISSLLTNPLSKIRWLRAVDVSNPGFAAIPQKAHNRNRIRRERGARKREVA